MPETKRAESATTPDAAADRVSQAEALLVSGLDQYFNGRYEEAIHVWTRVLFLDRSHARAHAYIERARTAIAERQRRGEEMLQASHELLERGEVDAARDLLIEVVAERGDDEQAAALRVKLERLERAHAGTDRRGTSAVDIPAVAPVWATPRRSRMVMILSSALGLGLLLAVGLTSPTVRTWMVGGSGTDALAAPREPTVVPVLSSSDVALVRARNLYSHGRLAEALLALDRIRADSPVRPEGEALRVEIQRQLLSGEQGGPRR